nr:helix-turn-helix domain-containing protein [Rhodococcus sp. (in: high G+C Gram-positive bacteria)]
MPIDAMEPPAEVILSTRGLIREGVTNATLMRAYRVGIIYWCERWTDAVERHCHDLALGLRASNLGINFLMGWFEMITDRISAEVHDEAERLTKEGSMARLAEVRKVLGPEAINATTASQRLGYDLRGNHVAILLSRIEEQDVALGATALAVAGKIANARPLTLIVDVDTAWCWVPVANGRTEVSAHPGVFVGVGRPGVGVDGFRRSHHEANEAVRIARLSDRRTGVVTHFDTIELASLCSGDPELCHAFIAAQLGGLAARTSHAANLRSTLRAYYDANCSFRSAAATLELHHNTVRYRLAQAERIMGQSILELRLQRELALRLALELENTRTAVGP